MEFQLAQLIIENLCCITGRVESFECPKQLQYILSISEKYLIHDILSSSVYIAIFALFHLPLSRYRRVAGCPPNNPKLVPKSLHKHAVGTPVRIRGSFS